MKIIVCGAGRVGQGIARRLASDGHAVTVIDENESLIESVTTDLEVQGVAGHAAHPNILRAAGAQDTDMIVAVTYSDEVNMVTCQVAQSLFDVQTKIARIRSPEYTSKKSGELFGADGFPIDVVISPERAVADSIFQRLETPGAFFSIPFASQKMRIIGVDVKDGTPLARTMLSQVGELFPELQIKVLAIRREEKFWAARRDDQLLPGDRVYVAINAEQTERLGELLGLSADQDQRIVVIGAGNIGYYVAQRLEKKRGRKVRLIETDLKRAEFAAANLNRSIVINGDGLSPEILEEAGVAKADAVIGLSNDDTVNLISSAIAKRLGAKKTIALVNSIELASIRSALEVDVVIDPRAVTISKILLRLRRGRILSLFSLESGLGEIVEGEVLEHSQLIDSDLSEESLPEGVTSGAVLRKDELIFPDRNFRVAVGDHIILFYERNKTKKAEQLFRASSSYFLN